MWIFISCFSDFILWKKHFFHLSFVNLEGCQKFSYVTVYIGYDHIYIYESNENRNSLVFQKWTSFSNQSVLEESHHAFVTEQIKEAMRFGLSYFHKKI